MNTPHPPQPGFEEPEEMSLGEWLSNLWEGRYTILGVALLVMATAAFYLWIVTPIYQIEAILQVEEKKSSNIDRALAELDSLFSGGTQAQTEIQILKSGMVLGRTIESLGMDISAQPVLFPLIGRAMAGELGAESFSGCRVLHGVGWGCRETHTSVPVRHGG